MSIIFQIRQILWGLIKKARHLRPRERRTHEVDQGGGSQCGIMELKSTDGGCLLTGGAVVIFIITRIPRRPSHNTHQPYSGNSTKAC